MYKKIQIRLTLLFTIVVGLILIVMSVFYLFTSEKALTKNNKLSFTNDINTLITNLEQQTTITSEWLTKTAANGKYVIAVYDHNIPLNYTTMNLTSEQKQLISDIKKYNNVDLSLYTGSDYTSIHKEFTYHSDDDSYYVCIGQIGPSSRNLNITIATSIKEFNHSLLMQRMRFLLIDAAGVLILFFFSFFYTKQLLKPIHISQQKQTAFIASASHELRTPLAVITSAVSAISIANEKQKKHFLNIIDLESKHMEVLVNDMLQLSRADSNSWSFHFAPVNLDTLLLETYESFFPLAKEKEISLDIELPEESLSPCLCDAEKTTQVLSILTSNALNYTPAGGKIAFSLSYDASHIYLTVADNGIGISDQAKPHIFDRFYRADNARSQKEHFGLGLCIAKEIMEKQKGSITVSDTPNGGATFTVSLPKK